ncbi:hypothetical protein [Pseudomonas sp. FME51]|uniref:hypothetical protein n=1 Tax=Pseudomonas sp. FME51 TaxID=2742609 RepID=UPI0018668573|nr:hypothetical protein [Pseudomonas sp. FME51]
MAGSPPSPSQESQPPQGVLAACSRLPSLEALTRLASATVKACERMHSLTRQAEDKRRLRIVCRSKPERHTDMPR